MIRKRKAIYGYRLIAKKKNDSFSGMYRSRKIAQSEGRVARNIGYKTNIKKVRLK